MLSAVINGLWSFFAIEYWNWNSPSTLAADAPVRAVFHHVEDAVASGFRDPFNAIDGLQSFFAEAVDRCKPLLSGSKYKRFFAPPAVRVAVAVSAVMQELTEFRQVIEDGLIGFLVELSF